MESSNTPAPFSPPRRLAVAEDIFSPPRKISTESLEQKLSVAPVDAAEAAYISSRVSHVNRIPDAASPIASPRSRSASLVATSTAAVELTAAKEEINNLKAKADERDHLQRNIQSLLQALRDSEASHKERIADLEAAISAEKFKSKILEEELTQIEKLYGTSKTELLSPKVASPQANLNIVPLSPSGHSQNLLFQITEIEKENRSLKKKIKKNEKMEQFLLEIEARISSIESQLKIKEIGVDPKFYKSAKDTVTSASDRLTTIRNSISGLHSETEFQALYKNCLFLETELSKHKTISNTERGSRKILEDSVKKMGKGEDFIISVVELSKIREENSQNIEKLKTSFRKQLENLIDISGDKLSSLEKELKQIQILSKKKFETIPKDNYIEQDQDNELIPNSPLASPKLLHSADDHLESPPILLPTLLED